jgi:hypothetical protein
MGTVGFQSGSLRAARAPAALSIHDAVPPASAPCGRTKRGCQLWRPRLTAGRAVSCSASRAAWERCADPAPARAACWGAGGTRQGARCACAQLHNAQLPCIGLAALQGSGATCVHCAASMAWNSPAAAAPSMNKGNTKGEAEATAAS